MVYIQRFTETKQLIMNAIKKTENFKMYNIQVGHVINY